MPFVETVDELAEWLADKVGVYGGHSEDGTYSRPFPDCDPENGQSCRICWTEHVGRRIREAVANEAKMKAM